MIFIENDKPQPCFFFYWIPYLVITNILGPSLFFFGKADFFFYWIGGSVVRGTVSAFGMMTDYSWKILTYARLLNVYSPSVKTRY